MTDAFVCSRWNGTRLSPSACGARWAIVNGGARGPVPGANPTISHAIHPGGCAGCHVGQQHRGGVLPERWPDGSPIVRLQLTPHGGGPPPRPAVRARANYRMVNRTPAATHTQDGLTLTTRGWAEHLRITVAAFTGRVARHGIQAAIAMGRPARRAA